MKRSDDTALGVYPLARVKQDLLATPQWMAGVCGEIAESEPVNVAVVAPGGLDDQTARLIAGLVSSGALGDLKTSGYAAQLLELSNYGQDGQLLDDWARTVGIAYGYIAHHRPDERRRLALPVKKLLQRHFIGRLNQLLKPAQSLLRAALDRLMIAIDTTPPDQPLSLDEHQARAFAVIVKDDLKQPERLTPGVITVGIAIGALYELAAGRCVFEDAGLDSHMGCNAKR